MRNKNHIFVCTLCLVLSLCLSSCGTKKGINHKSQISNHKSEIPSWHTCLIQGATGSIRMGDESYSAAITLQTVRDSMLVISIMPILGMEMIRVEATPTDFIIIDKFNGRYIQASFAELNKMIQPTLNWNILQQLCSAELPTGDEKARLHYNLDDKVIELVIRYTPRQLDVPVRVFHQRLDKYDKMKF